MAGRLDPDQKRSNFLFAADGETKREHGWIDLSQGDWPKSGSNSSSQTRNLAATEAIAHAVKSVSKNALELGLQGIFPASDAVAMTEWAPT
jgi:hypothetical protein